MRNTQLHLGMSLIHIRTYGMRAIPYIHECVVYLVCICVCAAAVIKQFDRWNSVWKNTQSPSRLHFWLCRVHAQIASRTRIILR